ncbi:MAG: 50S ribosomal protein L12 [Candidatus Bathyarchaeota archaeon]|nr:50S ribosomal protein L12 [Candidatus Bathyarchaeota archaeon]
MRYVYAALLLHASGKKVEEEILKNVLAASGGDVDPARIKSLVASLSEVNIDEAIKMAPGIAVTPASSEVAAPAKEETKEEETKEEEALAGLGALFE